VRDPSLLAFLNAALKTTKLMGRSITEKMIRAATSGKTSLKTIDERKLFLNPSREYVIGSRRDIHFNPPGSTATGKNTPPNKLETLPNIHPNGFPLL